MEKESAQALWQRLEDTYRAQEKRWSRLSLVFGLSKLVLLVTFFLTVYFIGRAGVSAWSGALAAAQAVLFAAACVVQHRLNVRMRFARAMAELAEKNGNRLTGEWRSFRDTGEELAGPEHEYARDLDIVGPESLFQFLNATGTAFGRARFAADLLHPDYTAEEITSRQEAVAELAGKPEFCCRLELLAREAGTEEGLLRAPQHLADGARFPLGRAARICFAVTRTVCCALLAAAAIFGGLWAAAWSVLFLVQLLIWALTLRRTRPFLSAMEQAERSLSRCGAPAAAVADEPWQSARLRTLAEVLGSAREPLRRLSGVAHRAAAGRGSILGILLNGLLLWDLWNACALDRWKSRWGAQAPRWFDALGEAESLLSFANLPRSCTGCCRPVETEGHGVLEAQSLGHPLIDNDARVCSDFSLAGGIAIVSGSNMSGKTTFLRTVGINLVLARAGSFAVAQSLTFSQMRVITSMRLTDSLSGRISLFYAELRRVRQILDAAQEDGSVLFLIDEIFRGTNSADRLAGARAVLGRLHALGACGLITTHDLEICGLAESLPGVRNFSFCETIRGGEMTFSYKLQQGPARTTNGRFLLRQLGILPPEEGEGGAG